jgi:hypothetical protein
MGLLAIFLLWGVLMGHCAGEIAVYRPPTYLSFMGVLMGHCASEIAVYGPPSYLSFMRCANGPMFRRNSCIWASQLSFLYGVC